MLGAIVGDIVGSRFEKHNLKSKEFQLFTNKSKPTDDTIMTLAVANALIESDGDCSNLGQLVIQSMQRLGQQYPRVGYGRSFRSWLMDQNPKPYNSCGNGAAMRVSPCVYVTNNMDEVKQLSKIVTDATHNHPAGIQGAEATAVAVFMARHHASKDDIQELISDDYYDLDFSLDEIRPKYRFDSTCQGSVPQAIKAFLESTDFEDAIRNAISIGGDSDTIAAITGSIAGAYYGIPEQISQEASQYLTDDLRSILSNFEAKFQVE